MSADRRLSIRAHISRVKQLGKRSAADGGQLPTAKAASPFTPSQENPLQLGPDQARAYISDAHLNWACQRFRLVNWATTLGSVSCLDVVLWEEYSERFGASFDPRDTLTREKLMGEVNEIVQKVGESATPGGNRNSDEEKNEKAKVVQAEARAHALKTGLQRSTLSFEFEFFDLQREAYFPQPEPEFFQDYFERVRRAAEAAERSNGPRPVYGQGQGHPGGLPGHLRVS